MSPPLNCRHAPPPHLIDTLTAEESVLPRILVSTTFCANMNLTTHSLSARLTSIALLPAWACTVMHLFTASRFSLKRTTQFLSHFGLVTNSVVKLISTAWTQTLNVWLFASFNHNMAPWRTRRLQAHCYITASHHPNTSVDYGLHTNSNIPTLLTLANIQSISIFSPINLKCYTPASNLRPHHYSFMSTPLLATFGSITTLLCLPVRKEHEATFGFYPSTKLDHLPSQRTCRLSHLIETAPPS